MPNTKTSALPALTGAGTATGDLFVIDDISTTTLKNITLAELVIALSTIGAMATDAELSAGLATKQDSATAATDAELALYLPKLAAGASVENIGAIESAVETANVTGTKTADTSLYGVFDYTMTAACTFTFSNPAPSGQNSTFVLILRGAFTPTLPAAVKWNGGTPATYTTPSIYTFTTVDAGTNWYGSQVGKAFA